MKPKQFTVLASAVIAAAILSSCSSTSHAPIDENTPGATFQEGVPGGTLVETYDLVATVTAVDVPARKLSLKAANGKKATVKCAPEIANLHQIKVGDTIKATVTSEVTVAMAKAGALPVQASTSLLAVRQKDGKPGALVAETQQYNATVIALDLKRRLVTLEFPDGSKRTFAARKDVDLTQRQVGEQVTFQVAVAMAVAVEKP